MRLLLDAHFSPAVSRPLRATGIDVLTLDEWHDRQYRDQDDALILEVAFREDRTLVTYDQRFIPGILAKRAESGLSHAGLIYVNS